MAVTLVGAGVAATPALARAQKKIRWRMALAVPKTLSIWGPGMIRFSEQVEQLTGGQLSIKVYGAGELVPALGTFDAVQSGKIQMGHAASYYWQGKIAASPFFTNVPFGMKADGTLAWLRAGGGQELWDKLMRPFGVRCLPCGTTGHQTMGWFKKEIKTAEDLKGLKVRVPGLAGKVYAKAGALPVLLPGGELYTSLATGVVDAVEWVGPYHDVVLGLHKAAPIFYGTSWHEPGAILELMINEDAWRSLPEPFQLAIQLAAADATAWMRARFEAENARYYVKLREENKNRMLQLPEDVLMKLKEYSDELLAEIAKVDSVSREIYDSFNAFKKDYESFYKWVEAGYYCG